MNKYLVLEDWQSCNMFSIEYINTSLTVTPGNVLAWGPSYFRTKIFRVEQARLKINDKIADSLLMLQRFITYSCTRNGKFRIDPLMTNVKNTHIFRLPGGECRLIL